MRPEIGDVVRPALAVFASALSAAFVFAAVIAAVRAIIGIAAGRRQARMRQLDRLFNGERIERHTL
jgi:hypothetical protein